VTIKNCVIYEAYMSALILDNSTGITVENCDIYQGAKDKLLKYWSTNTWTSTVITVGTANSVIRNCKIHDSYFEGIDIIKGSENVILEHSEIYGNNQLQVYVSNSRNNTVRYNLIYGTGENKNGSGIWLGGEDWAVASWPSPTWNTGHKVYGNFVAATRSNLRVSGESQTYQTDSQVYNNTFVECVGAGTDWERSVLYSNVVGGGHIFRNNIIVQTENSPASVKSGVVVSSNNLWTQPEGNIDADIRGAGSLYASNPQLAKSGGWTSASSGYIKTTDFKIRSGSPAIDAGYALGSPFNSDAFGGHRPQGSAFDIGAHEFSSGAGDTTPPAAPGGLSVG
jgi:hypothetical protein